MERDPASPRPLGPPPFDLGGDSTTGELARLERLALLGVPLAAIVVVPAAAEERFYLLNNLPERINALFRGVPLDDPDEDDIEELAPQVQALLRNHYLLDEEIDAFYLATRPLGDRLRLRRPGSAGTTAIAGRPALLALKRCWATSWHPEAVLTRLRQRGTLAPTATPILIHAIDAAVGAEWAQRVGHALAVPVEAFGLPDGSVSRVLTVT